MELFGRAFGLKFVLPRAYRKILINLFKITIVMEEKPEEYTVRKQHKPTLSRDWAPVSRKKETSNNLLSLESPPKSSAIKNTYSSPTSSSTHAVGKANYMNYWKNRVNSPKNVYNQLQSTKPKNSGVASGLPAENYFEEKRLSIGGLSDALIDPPTRPSNESKHLVKSSFDESKLREHISLASAENLTSMKKKAQAPSTANEQKKPTSLTSSYYYSLYGNSTASKLLNLYENCYSRSPDNNSQVGGSYKSGARSPQPQQPSTQQ